MNNLFFSLFFLFFSCITFGQNSYIQVTGEPDLSVYLNSQFKGKTTTEFNGYIVEGVSAGKNSIRIVKDGYTPYEETITVKAGEVFAYKVKPFTKTSVYISESGNTGETEKKALVETGKLVVQSVPIDIKLTIPNIEGVKDSPKAKDKWMADNIPKGEYEISISYGQKKITKKITISKDRTTTVFVNMLSSEFTEKSEDMSAYKTKSEAIEYINRLLTSQGKVMSKKWACSDCKDSEGNPKENTTEVDYVPDSFKYSEQDKTYSLYYEITNHIWGSDKIDTEKVKQTFSGIRLGRDIAFTDKGQFHKTNHSSGSMVIFSFRVESTDSYMGFCLASAETIPQLRKAIGSLQELD